MKNRRNLIKKGQVLNPNGRPRGALNEATKNYVRFKHLASEKYQEAFNMLWEAMQAKEGWAFNLYFKDLLPKRLHQPTIFVKTEGKTADDRIAVIIEEMSKFNELTHEEALNEIKVLRTGSNELDNVYEGHTPDTRAQLMEKIEAIQKVIDYKKTTETKI